MIIITYYTAAETVLIESSNMYVMVYLLRSDVDTEINKRTNLLTDWIISTLISSSSSCVAPHGGKVLHLAPE